MRDFGKNKAWHALNQNAFQNFVNPVLIKKIFAKK